MSRLVWDQVGEKTYQTGAKNGVLYDQTAGKYDHGVAWNGLTAVNETPSGGEATDIYADDAKYLSLMSAETLGATIEAYTTPKEFDKYNGEADIEDGVTVGQQDRGTFGFVYVSTIGNDTDGNKFGYIIHCLYGCKASPSEESHSTINESPEAITLSYSINTTPVPVTVNGEQKKTASLKINSTKITAAQLKAIEDVLFGSDEHEARLPLPDEIADIIKKAKTQG